MLTVVPEGVRYAVVASRTRSSPASPSSMSVQRVDIVTGQLVTSDDRNFTLRAFSGNSPRPDFSLNPAGVLADTVGHDRRRRYAPSPPRATTGPRPSTCGSATAPASRPSATSSSCCRRPPALVELWAEDMPGHELDRPLRPDESVMVHVRATDAVGNPVRGRAAAGRGASTATAASAAPSAQVFTMVADIDGPGQRRADGRRLRHPGHPPAGRQRRPALDRCCCSRSSGRRSRRCRFDPVGAAFRDGYYVTPDTEIIPDARPPRTGRHPGHLRRRGRRSIRRGRRTSTPGPSPWPTWAASTLEPGHAHPALLRRGDQRRGRGRADGHPLHGQAPWTPTVTSPTGPTRSTPTRVRP